MAKAVQLNGHEFEQTPGNSEGQGCLECCSLRGHKELDPLPEDIKVKMVPHFNVSTVGQSLFHLELCPTLG